MVRKFKIAAPPNGGNTPQPPIGETPVSPVSVAGNAQGPDSITGPPEEPPVPRADRARAWMITINNPSDQEKLEWSRLTEVHPWIRSVEGQVEQGQNGTPHIQGLLKTETVRFAQVKRALPRAHIEAVRNLPAATRYVHKTESRIATLDSAVATKAPQEVLQRSLTELVATHLATHRLERNERTNQWMPVEDGMNPALPPNPRPVEFMWALQQPPVRPYLLQKGVAERFLDDAVGALLRQGRRDIAFAMSNQQNRNAYLRYFPDWVYRDVHDHSTQDGPPPLPTLEDAPSID